MLGICLGSQLLARAFGADNQIGAAPRIRLAQRRPDQAARGDPVLGVAPRSFSIFQWHDDTFTLPARRGQACENEAAAKPGVPHWPRHLRHPVPFRSRPRRWSANGTRAFADYLAERQPDWPERFESRGSNPRPRSGCGRPRDRARLGCRHLTPPLHFWHVVFLSVDGRSTALALRRTAFYTHPCVGGCRL